VNPHRTKYFPMYMSMAVTAAEQSYCVRKKVGALLVLPTGMLSVGYNGTPAGMANVCELSDGTTDPMTIHAEDNCIRKTLAQGVDVTGSILFVTLSPCGACAELIIKHGISAVYYRRHHRETAIESLRANNIIVEPWRNYR
jgi:dCMP deaminase